MNSVVADQLMQIRERGERASKELSLEHQQDLQMYRSTITEAVKGTVSNLKANVARITNGNATCTELTQHLGTYVDWLQWSFWDLPHLALALGIEPSRLRASVSSCGMVYLSLRLFDDVIDRHHSYKGRHDTLLAMAHQHRRSNQSAQALATLGALLLCFEGLETVLSEPDELGNGTLKALIGSVRRAVLGATMELSPSEEWQQGHYDRMIQLKNVEFWKALYAGLEPEGKSPLLPFLERYYALAQKINDVQDYIDDERRGQPNFVNIHRSAMVAGDAVASNARGIPETVEIAIAEDLAKLSEAAVALPPRGRLVAEAKLCDVLADAERAGLFARPVAKPASAPATALGLAWYSDVGEILSRFGSSALVERSCGACGSSERRFVFRKQGFSYHRCTVCTHLYVHPGLRPDLAYQLGLELDDADHESTLLEVQRYYAAAICALLRARAPGRRLLDVGFGRGYLVELARAYGFETYGVESSTNQIEALEPRMGRRVHRASMEDTKLPWGSFDAVVISHVLEHMDAPKQFLSQVFEALNPEGVLYVAVPDMESAQFRVFGKNWDPISPLAHQQYFNRASLEHLLASAGFDEPERVDHVPVPKELAPRWMRFLRELGGSDSGELSILARKPPR